MTNIPFTQYMRPDGRPVVIHIDRPDDIATKAQAIIARGYRFEAEVLTTGDVSFTIGNDDGDIDIEVVPNDPDVHEAVDRLVLRNSKEPS